MGKSLNDSTLAGRGFFIEYIWPSLRDCLAQTLAVLLLLLSAIQLFVTTTEGTLELATFVGMAVLWIAPVISEANARCRHRRRHAMNFVGPVLVRDGTNSWKEIPSCDVCPGDVIHISIFSY